MSAKPVPEELAEIVRPSPVFFLRSGLRQVALAPSAVLVHPLPFLPQIEQLDWPSVLHVEPAPSSSSLEG